jgi:hypothetical protein
MAPDAPVDDNTYTIGLAAFTCLLPLPIMYFVSLPLILAHPAPWKPWLPALPLMLTPPLTAFTILYHGPWHHNWSRPKRTLLGILLSLLIVSAEFMLIAYVIVISCFEFSNFLFSPDPSSRGQY